MKNSVKKLCSILNYEVNNSNIDFDKLNPESVFVGDIYCFKYKTIFSWEDAFEKSTDKTLVMKDAILLRIDFEKYINLTDIINKKSIDIASENLILGEYYMPVSNSFVAYNMRNFSELKAVKCRDVISLKTIYQIIKYGNVDFNEIPQISNGKLKLKVLGSMLK